MLVPGELLRAAGNVFLSPTDLATRADAVSWKRALIVGSADPGVVAELTRELRAAALGLAVDVLAPRPLRLSQVRRQRYDVVCLALTGEGRRGEKLLGLRAGARAVLARGKLGRWYQINLPACRPMSARWWGRVLLVLLPLVVLYWLVVEFVLLGDVLRGLRRPRPIADPGPVAEKRVTFIVPTYNQRGLMDFCLPALLAEAGDRHAIVVVDDASTDDTAAYVCRTYPSVQMIRLERNEGFAGAVRAGVAASDTTLFALINNDAQVRPGFLAAVLPHFDEPDVFAVCARLELPDGSQLETGRVAPAFSGILEPYHLPPADRPVPILYAGGASSVFHRARYDALGGLDTLYHPFYWEDIELGYRAWRAGWRSLFEPRASVLHQRRATIGTRFGDEYANQAFLKNALLFVLKNVRDRGLMTQHFGYVAARLAQEVPEGGRTMRRAVLGALGLLPRALRARAAEYLRGGRADREVLACASPAWEQAEVAGR